jgi:hypothetical protein
MLLERRGYVISGPKLSWRPIPDRNTPESGEIAADAGYTVISTLRDCMDSRT